MAIKVKLKICGEVRTHIADPVSPAHTLCGNQLEEDDDVCDTEIMGDAPDNARITCRDCKEIIEFCKQI